MRVRTEGNDEVTDVPRDTVLFTAVKRHRDDRGRRGNRERRQIRGKHIPEARERVTPRNAPGQCVQEDEEHDIEHKLATVPKNGTIQIDNLTYSYSGAERDYALKGISLTIPEGKVTAIVGESGSGKTTLIKLLQGFYKPNDGTIKVGGVNIDNINPHVWRKSTGSVMQESFIFSDTIAKNIALSTDDVDVERLYESALLANADEFISALPLSYNTRIGMEGCGVSQGQRQRLLIARAIYKNPKYLFFDEATNSLDATNERIIMENLHKIFENRTVVIAAHRLSTVMDADNIVVMKNGRIVEQGTHEELIRLGGYYKKLNDMQQL